MLDITLGFQFSVQDFIFTAMFYKNNATVTCSRGTIVPKGFSCYTSIFFFLQTARKGLNSFFVFCLFFLNVHTSFRGVFQKPFKTFEDVNYTSRIDNEFMLNHD